MIESDIQLEADKEKIKKTTREARLDLDQIFRFVETVSVVPTHVPKKFIDQVKIYYLSADTHLYIYDNKNNNWKSAQLS